jgi:hypothetical protein
VRTPVAHSLAAIGNALPFDLRSLLHEIDVSSLASAGLHPGYLWATENLSDHALDVELAVAGAIEDLGFSTDIIEVALDLASIETLASRRPLIAFNLVDTLNGDDRFAPLVPARLDALGIGYTETASVCRAGPRSCVSKRELRM